MGIMDLLWNPDTGRRPHRLMFYGEQGAGKTTLAMQYPGAVLLPLEDGFQNLDAESTRGRILPICRNLADIKRLLTLLSNEEHSFTGVVIDKISTMDQWVCQDLAARLGKSTVGDIGYGKGDDKVAEAWRPILDELEDLQLKRNMAFLFTADSHVEKVKNPDTDPYQQNRPALNGGGQTAVCGWCDEVFFLTTKVYTMEKDVGFGATRTKATGGDQRIIFTDTRPGHYAKNRLPGLPHEIPMGTWDKPEAWNHIKQYLPKPPPIKGPHSREPGDESEVTTTFPN